MRILILANHDDGLYLFRRELIQELLRRDNEVLISVPYGERVSYFTEIGCRCFNTKVDRRGINPEKDFKLFLKYTKMIKILLPDIVITYTIKPNIYGGFVCRLIRIPYAVNITGLGTAFENDGLIRKLVTVMYKVSLKKAKVVFFENAANRDLFINEEIIRADQVCLLNGAGVNLEQFEYTPYPHNDVFHFLFIGRVMREKGIDELFSAMKRIVAEGGKCILDVVGPFEDDYKKILEGFGKDGWLKYQGKTNDVRPFIAACDCFVLPSWHEGMANTNLECAASGRPIITSNIAGCKEAVIEGVSGFLCEPKNSNSLYDKMKHMIQVNRKDREAMGVAGRKHMEAVFDKKDVIRDTMNVLRKAIDAKSR